MASCKFSFKRVRLVREKQFVAVISDEMGFHKCLQYVSLEFHTSSIYTVYPCVFSLQMNSVVLKCYAPPQPLRSCQSSFNLHAVHLGSGALSKSPTSKATCKCCRQLEHLMLSLFFPARVGAYAYCDYRVRMQQCLRKAE